MSRKGEISIGIIFTALISMSIAAFGFLGNAVSKNGVDAREAKDIAIQSANLVKNMNGALKFLVEKNGGEYDPNTGIVILKNNIQSKITSSTVSR